MDRNIESRELDIIDLGAASVETKGSPGATVESAGEFQKTGLSED